MGIDLKTISMDSISLEEVMKAMEDLGQLEDNLRRANFAKRAAQAEMPIRWIRNGPATILFWKDGSKTIVKCNKEDEFDAQKGFLMACFEKWTGLSKHQIGKLMEKVNDNEEWRSPYHFWK